MSFESDEKGQQVKATTERERERNLEREGSERDGHRSYRESYFSLDFEAREISSSISLYDSSPGSIQYNHRLLFLFFPLKPKFSLSKIFASVPANQTVFFTLE